MLNKLREEAFTYIDNEIYENNDFCVYAQCYILSTEKLQNF